MVGSVLSPNVLDTLAFQKIRLNNLTGEELWTYNNITSYLPLEKVRNELLAGSSGFIVKRYKGVEFPWLSPTNYETMSIRTTLDYMHFVYRNRGIGSTASTYYATGYRQTESFGHTDCPFGITRESINYNNLPGLIGSGKPMIDPYEQQLLINQFIDNFSDNADWGATAGELLRDYKGLARLASKLFRGMKALKRGNFRKLRRVFGSPDGGGAISKKLSNRYLQYVYAIAPLAQDIYTTTKILANHPVHGYIHRTRQRRKYDFDSLGDHGSHVKGYRAATVNIHYIVTDPEAVQKNALGLSNPLAVAWELVPWSFVLDWALPVGNILQSFTTFNGYGFISGYTSMYAEGTAESRYETDDVWAPHTTCTRQYKAYSREKLLDFPQAKLLFKNPFSTTHAINAIALWRGRQRW